MADAQLEDPPAAEELEEPEELEQFGQNVPLPLTQRALAADSEEEARGEDEEDDDEDEEDVVVVAARWWWWRRPLARRWHVRQHRPYH